MRDCKVWSVDTVSADMEQRDSQVYLHDTAACSFTTAIYSKEMDGFIPRTANVLFNFHVTICLVKLELILEDG